MTEINKYNIRTHFRKYLAGYSLLVFLAGVVGIIGLEARGIL
jgi:hypothetical protein